MNRLIPSLAVALLAATTAACNSTNTRADSPQSGWYDLCVQRLSELDRNLPVSSREKLLAHLEYCEGGPLTAEQRTRLTVVRAIFAWESNEAQAFSHAVDDLDGASLIETAPDGRTIDMVQRLKNLRSLRTSRSMSRPTRDLINAARYQGNYYQ